MKRYNVLYSDPPWPGKPSVRHNKETGNFDPHSAFPTMTHAELAALPVADILADDAMVFMWVIGRSLETSFSILRAWGVEFKSIAFTWVKPTRLAWDAGESARAGHPKFMNGLGYWTRQNAELCLLATRGTPTKFCVKEEDRPAISSIIYEPRGEVVCKPPCTRDRILQLAGTKAPRLEMFARTKTPGWDVWGNEVESTVKIARHDKIASTIGKKATHRHAFERLSSSYSVCYCGEEKP